VSAEQAFQALHDSEGLGHHRSGDDGIGMYDGDRDQGPHLCASFPQLAKARPPQ
jgi:hypothetical protein